MHNPTQVCAQLVYNHTVACGQNQGLINSPAKCRAIMRKSHQFIPALYTLCIQKYTANVGNTTSVLKEFYTVYTGLTKTTTKYIQITY